MQFNPIILTPSSAITAIMPTVTKLCSKLAKHQVSCPKCGFAPRLPAPVRKRKNTMRIACLLCILSMLHAILSTSIQTNAQETKSANPEPFAILAWNIEIGGSEIATIKEQLKELEPFEILALSEVPKKSVNEFANLWSQDSFIVGEKGGEACLLLAWDTTKFDKIKFDELTKFEDQEFAPGIQAAPLIAQLRHKQSKMEFNVVMNHLARGSAELRKRQALILVEWAKKQSLPIIAVGGYNFDYDIPTKKGNEAFDAFLNGGTWKWIEPQQLIDTNWADRNRDGKDDYPDSMLDFAFAAGPARTWGIQSEIIVRDRDFPDTEKTSDQRPIHTTVTHW